MPDRIFDGWAERFQQRIYAEANPKGLIRTEILQHDLLTVLPSLPEGSLNILEVGGGLGQFTLWLSGMGHQVTYTEPSADMLNAARNNFDAANLDNPPNVIQARLQDLPSRLNTSYDLVICHAVLEWLAEPFAAIPVLQSLASPNGLLSVMFYNKHSAVLRSLVVGDFERALSRDLSGDGVKRLAPISPLEPGAVVEQLLANGFRLERWSGVRTFYDYMLPQVRVRADTDAVIAAERQLCTSAPWRSLGRYQHVVTRRNL